MQVRVAVVEDKSALICLEEARSRTNHLTWTWTSKVAKTDQKVQVDVEVLVVI